MQRDGYLKSGIRNLLSNFWILLNIYSMFVFIGSAAYLVASSINGDIFASPNEWSNIVSMMFIIAAFVIFVGSFGLLFVCSLTERGKRLADKIKLFHPPNSRDMTTFKEEIMAELRTELREAIKELEARLEAKIERLIDSKIKAQRLDN